MQKQLVVGLWLVLSACSRVAIPSLPISAKSSDQKAKPIYTGEDGSLGSIEGTLPAGSDTDPLESGETDLPISKDPVVKMPEEIPKPTDPMEIPSDPVSDPASFRTISVNPSENLGIWEGFGVNLGSWANAVGASDFQDVYADVLFTQKNTAFNNSVLPGLGLSIVRYAIGGGGRENDFADFVEIKPLDFAPHRNLEGYWINGDSEDLSSQSFDWTRDANQRSMMTAAKDRGIRNFEFYSQAPMWWMTEERNSFGGLVTDLGLYSKYLSSVVEYARNEWNIPVASLSPFNEPSSDRWASNPAEQGSNFSVLRQGEVLGKLKEEFSLRGLESSVSFSGSDEASSKAALESHLGLKSAGLDIYEKINVHTADRGQASRDLKGKEGLRLSAGEKRIWVSEHSDSEIDGLSLAASIIEDVKALKATAWIYGQGVDAQGSRGLLYGNFDMAAEVGVRGKPSAVSVKHFILAQFSRFVRPGQQIISGGDKESLVAYDPTTRRLSLVILNNSKIAQDVDVDLSMFNGFSTAISHVVSRGDGMKVWKAKSVGVFSRKIRVNVEGGSVSSLEIPDVVLK